jgi:hypothetical protein
MHEVLGITAIDLKSQILEGFKCQDPEVYSKIVAFQEAFKISDATGDRHSISLLLDLFFSFEHGLVNPNAVLHEINYLEGKEKKSRAKEASMFKRHPLKGLWHKHYYDGSISALANNVKNALHEYKLPYFEKMIAEANDSGEERFVAVEDVPHIVNDAISGNLQRRSDDGKITGEWVVYACHEGINYYLCLARHNDGDEKIRSKIESSCVFEFPFLGEILS